MVHRAKGDLISWREGLPDCPSGKGEILTDRGSGILFPISSLPSPWGIGDLGPAAYRFIDFLHKAEQKYWQILPMNPTTASSGNSPYLSSSAFAGNTDLISPDFMERDGFIGTIDRGGIPDFPDDRVDYVKVRAGKKSLFSLAYDQKCEEISNDREYLAFCHENELWLEDYALFQALWGHYGEKNWNAWPGPIRSRNHPALAECRNRFEKEIGCEKFLQFIFFRQWKALHCYTNDKGIRILGDLPIYVHFNSADVWTHPGLFRLDADCSPAVIAGVPPDYFSTTGQIWNNPLYLWQEHERTGFSWWIDRFRHNFSLFDLVRIDHFRGLVAYYAIPAGAKDATGGQWVRAPALSFLRTMKETFAEFPVIAEDLGTFTPDVHEIMEEFGLPGMRVLEFAFTEETAANPHAPHNLLRELILYTGTHDNAPVRAWFEQYATANDRRRVHQYLGWECTADEVPEFFIRLAMMSVAKTTILPLQDILGLGNEARMNTPGTQEGNWEWRAVQHHLNDTIACHLREMTRVYGRSRFTGHENRA
ncbi:MAG: 4-alpha-glucanotransferase [Methanoregula sp.]|jgi:4-alpha-glucanotransferase|nr:4-alpha-glucanotransferase [Methanoregula sp.]